MNEAFGACITLGSWGKQGRLRVGGGGGRKASSKVGTGASSCGVIATGSGEGESLKGQECLPDGGGRWRVQEQEAGCTSPTTVPLTCHWWRLGRRRVASGLKGVVLGQGAPGAEEPRSCECAVGSGIRARNPPGRCLHSSVSSWWGCSFLPSFLGGFPQTSTVTLAELREKV